MTTVQWTVTSGAGLVSWWRVWRTRDSHILSTTSSPLAIPCLPALTLCHRPWEPLTIDLQRPRSLLSQPSLADPLPPLLRAACPCPFCALRACNTVVRGSCTEILRPLPTYGVGPPSLMGELAAGAAVAQAGDGSAASGRALVLVGRLGTSNRAREGGQRRQQRRQMGGRAAAKPAEAAGSPWVGLPGVSGS